MEPSQPNQESAVTELKSSGLAVKKWVAITLIAICVLVSWTGTIDVKSEKSMSRKPLSKRWWLTQVPGHSMPVSPCCNQVKLAGSFGCRGEHSSF